MHWAEFKDILKRGVGRGTCPHQLAFLLEFTFRRFILSPERLAERLELEEAARVLELGPGPGYFSRAVARRIPRGFLLLVDLQSEMLEKARGKLARAGLGNVGFVQADGAALPVPSGAWDCVFLVAVLGEVSDSRSCLREIYRVLRPGGLLSLTEQPGDPDFVALPDARKLLEGVGFRFEKVYGGGKNYTASFRKLMAES
jgi:ubiquinone/menaquinone biosynthesis C-methylase UbiE